MNAQEIEDDDMGDMWRAHHAERQQKRADNRKSSQQLLAESGISFESKNNEAHLIVTAKDKTIDFWPGTGLWIVRGEQKRHGGVFKLIKFIKGIDKEGG